MFMGNHTTWHWTSEEEADWKLAQNAIRAVWATCSGRLGVTDIPGFESVYPLADPVALRNLMKRLEAEYNLLERTDHDTVWRVLRDYPKLAKAVENGTFLEFLEGK